MADYYDILGVSRSATQDEIKRAYRKKARTLHPDVAGPDKADEFKEVTGAYEVLSNEEKRRLYDMGGESAVRNGGGGAGGFGGSFHDIFDTFFGGSTAARGPVPRGRRGQDALVPVEIDLIDATFGIETELTIDTAIRCKTCNGTCSREGSEPTTCTACGGSGSVRKVTNSFLGQVMSTSSCGVCQGHGTVITDPCLDCAGEGRVRAQQTLQVKIPAGIEDGMRIRMPGRGEVGPAGGPQGDLFVEVHVKHHPEFTRQGDDLVCELEIPMTAAALGTTMTIESFDGPQNVEIEPGTSGGVSLRVRGKGVGRLHRSDRGDLVINIHVQTPTKLSSREKELLKELAEIRGETQPEGNLVSESSSVFSRFKDRFR
ncbi:molecular chaperone DnaJ [Flaviflexus massiliensis]|uniref:molecular chaperone DnaJ n=1 Tax=Flaviflexus massiliensis TaxID=1522309 RepID=UPI0006D58547|nr:molecular chaperone DnaJ [Flaviflexus massiliensis]